MAFLHVVLETSVEGTQQYSAQKIQLLSNFEYVKLDFNAQAIQQSQIKTESETREKGRLFTSFILLYSPTEEEKTPTPEQLPVFCLHHFLIQKGILKELVHDALCPLYSNIFKCDLRLHSS